MFGGLVGVFEAPDEELAAEGDVGCDVAVHGVFGQHVDAEFFAGFSEAEEGVEGEDVCEDAPALVVMDKVEELLGKGFAGLGELSVFGGVVEVVDACMLVVEGFGEDETAYAFGSEHALDEGLEDDVAVVHVFGDGATELQLVRLEVVSLCPGFAGASRHVARVVGLLLAQQATQQGRVVAYPELRPNRVHAAAMLVGRSAQDLGADCQGAAHVLGFAYADGDGAQHEGALADHALAQGKRLLGEPSPVVGHGSDVDVDVAEAVVVVGRVFVVDAALQPEAGRGHVCDDPLLVPHRIRVLAHGAGAQCQRRVFLVAVGQGGRQLGEDEGVGGEGVDVGQRQVACAVEGELDRVPGL